MKLSMTLTAAALAAALAAPVAAQNSVDFAVNQFNMSADRVSDVIENTTSGEAVSVRGNSALSVAIRNFNASQDSVSDRIVAETVTNFAGKPAYGAEIFEALRLADDDN